jgi:hypothetical protein
MAACNAEVSAGIMLVARFNVVNAQSVPLNSLKFRSALGQRPSRRRQSLALRTLSIPIRIRPFLRV